MGTCGAMKTSAFHSSAQGKADRMSAFSGKLAVGVFRKASRRRSAEGQQPLGSARALALDVHVGPRGLRSLPDRGASPSWLRLRSEPA